VPTGGLAPGPDEPGQEDGHAVSCVPRPDRHGLIRVHGARVNNLKDPSVEHRSAG